jgi:hypothetical protein
MVYNEARSDLQQLERIMADGVKWEFRSVWFDKEWKASSEIHDKGVQYAEPLGLVEYLNNVGQQGWDVVAIIPVEVGYRVILKHPF